jgi:anti-sigma factor RsiW
MSCPELQQELIAYHFGMVSDETRGALEAHLVICPACVKAFVTIKHDIETGEGGARPSEAVRLRLRRAVAQELGIGERRRWSWWERPFAFGFAGVAVALAMFVVSVLATSTATMPHSLADGTIPSRPVPGLTR